jgi:hypothetical protein
MVNKMRAILSFLNAVVDARSTESEILSI